MIREANFSNLDRVIELTSPIVLRVCQRLFAPSILHDTIGVWILWYNPQLGAKSSVKNYATSQLEIKLYCPVRKVGQWPAISTFHTNQYMECSTNHPTLLFPQ